MTGMPYLVMVVLILYGVALAIMGMTEAIGAFAGYPAQRDLALATYPLLFVLVAGAAVVLAIGMVR
jgi:hypothetical protein